MARVLLVAGTWGLDRTWWRPGSSFARALARHGHVLAAPDDPYSWTGALEGIVGPNTTWEQEGKALRWYLGARDVDAIIAHSDGGQVVAYALADHLAAPIPAVVTVAMPVRADMAAVYRLARDRIARWVHVRSDASDWIQWVGSLPRLGVAEWWGWAPWRVRRSLALADRNLFAPGVGHAGLLEPALWDRFGWWTVLDGLSDPPGGSAQGEPRPGT